MRPLAYTLPYAWLFWAVFLLAYVPEYALVARSRQAKGETTDRGSMAVIMLAGWLGSLAAFVVAGFPRFRIAHGQKAWFVAGLVILLCGSLLRRRA